MENYIEQISSMKYRVLNGFVSPHKAIMLLAVIDMIEFDLVEGNNFFIDDETKQSFLFNWEQYLGERKLPYKANPWAPFWHLKHEPFWHLIPIDGDDEKVKNLAGPGETPHVGQMRSVIAYAKLDEELYELLKDADFRDRVKQILVEKYINPKPQDKVAQHHTESRFAETDVILTYPVDHSVYEHGFTIESAAEFDAIGQSVEKGRSANITLNYWILVCNPKYYNIREAFANLKTLFWTKVRNMKSIQVGDIVFVYVTKPEMKIMYMAEVLDAHVDYKDRRADEEEEYDREERAQETTPTELVEIRFIQSCDNNGLSLAALREKGFTGSLQTPQTIKNDELRKYIQSFFV